MLVYIDNDTALKMLMDRVNYWTDNEKIHSLYEQMYENYIDGGIFDGGEYDVMDIVDNDYVNYCHVLCEGEESYNEIKKIYDVQGLGDCSYDIDGISYIEAEYNGLFLVRY